MKLELIGIHDIVVKLLRNQRAKSHHEELVERRAFDRRKNGWVGTNRQAVRDRLEHVAAAAFNDRGERHGLEAAAVKRVEEHEAYRSDPVVRRPGRTLRNRVPEERQEGGGGDVRRERMRDELCVVLVQPTSRVNNGDKE